MGVSLRSSSNDEGSSQVWMALLEQHNPSSPVFHNLRCFFHAVSEENSTEEGIPSPLAPSLLVAFYDTQRIRWCYSLLYAQHHISCFIKNKTTDWLLKATVLFLIKQENNCGFLFKYLYSILNSYVMLQNECLELDFCQCHAYTCCLEIREHLPFIIHL